MTAVVDDVRRRLRLTLPELAGLSAAAAGHDPGPAGVALRASGLLTDDGPVPLALDLCRCLARPTLRLFVEVAAPQGPTVSEVVVSGEDVWHTEPWPGADETEPVVWQRTELNVLLWELARMVGLRRGPASDAPPVTADVGSLGRVLDLVTALPPEEADALRTAVLASSTEDLEHLSAADRTGLRLVVAHLQASWRITCFWGDLEVGADGRDRGGVRGLAVLDCGALGYWRRTAPVEPMTVADLDPATPVRLEPAGAPALWRALADLLPSGDEMRAAAAAVRA
ncbi:MAG: hypothetical protein JWO60_3179 [Frankiales bacterium]|nr:hypothetical protein [Frankiales bacterium]